MNTATAEKQNKIMYISQAENFSKIPGSQIAYWASSAKIACFGNGIKIDNIAQARQGIIPGNVDAFLRLWQEVNINKVGFNHIDYSDIVKFKKKWFPYNKGGSFRRWYGNLEYLINMENNGYDIKYSGLNNNYRLREPELYFKESISWSKISSGLFSMRYMPKGTLFDIAGCCVFGLNDNEKYVLALANSIVVLSLMEFLGATLNYEVDQIKKIPIIFNKENKETIEMLTDENIVVSKSDWDLFETSWDFKKHPLI